MLPEFSFEFFSPKSAAAATTLTETLDVLSGFEASLCSVTVGTGNGSPSQTDETLAVLKTRQTAPVAAHIAAAGYSMDDLRRRADAHLANGVRSAVAIRGDDGGGASVGMPDLVGMLADKGMAVYVGAYPETHPQAASRRACLDALKAKQDAGAKAAITQFFFHADLFFAFRDRAAAAGITLDLIPGILPVTNWAATSKMAAQCGTHIEPDLAEAFARAAREDRAELMAMAQGAELCDKLIQGGVDHLHFYTLNRAAPVAGILEALGHQQKKPFRHVA